DLLVGGDDLDPYAVAYVPDLADMAAEKGGGPGAGRDADDLVAEIALAPAHDCEHGLLDILGALQKLLACGQQLVAGLAPHEERLADLVFESGDTTAERRGAELGRTG